MGVLWQRATGFTGTNLGLCCHYGIRNSCIYFEGIQAVQVGSLLTFLGPSGRVVVGLMDMLVALSYSSDNCVLVGGQCSAAAGVDSDPGPLGSPALLAGGFCPCVSCIVGWSGNTVIVYWSGIL